jgi:hypothetical protein
MDSFRLLGENGMGDGRAGINQARNASKLAFDSKKVPDGLRHVTLNAFIVPGQARAVR